MASHHLIRDAPITTHRRDHGPWDRVRYLWVQHLKPRIWRRRMPDGTEAQAREALAPQLEPTKKLPNELQWLLDAPLFIDSVQVEAFYDAVLRPDYEGDTLVLRDSVSTEAAFESGLKVGAGIPWFGKGEVDLSATLGRTRGHEREGTVHVVSNAYRHLLALAMHYAGSKPDRLVLAHPQDPDRSVKAANGDTVDLTDPSFATTTPRALIFLDLPAKTKFIPTAVELEDGRVQTLFGELAAAQQVAGDQAPWGYPATDASEDERNRYWQWYADYFRNSAALEVVENAVGEGTRLSWIDFRVPLGTDSKRSGPSMHLHIRARGGYDTGTFAYNLVGRGFRHGIRIVGTLKSEPDLNVLAIFDR